METRPEELMRELVKKYPKLTPKINEVITSGDRKAWPPEVLIPFVGWASIYKKYYPEAKGSLEDMIKVSDLMCVGTWRYSQGIYRLNSDLLKSLEFTTDLPNNIPLNVFTRLPEWCLYLDVQIPLAEIPTYGYFILLDWDQRVEKCELRIVADTETGLTAIPITLAEEPLTDAVAVFASEEMRDDSVPKLIPAIKKILSILLYLCSNEPEIDNERMPGTSPVRGEPQKIKDGWAVFPLSQPHIWRVGEKIGEKLRQEKSAMADTPHESAKGVHRRLHLRRAHWHGFWTGPKESKREFVYYWMPPLFVGGK